MFIRRKMIGKRERFYLVENTRQDGKVKQKVLAYLGESDTVEGAIAQNETALDKQKHYLAVWQERAAAIAGGRTMPPKKRHEHRRHVCNYWNLIKMIEVDTRVLREIEQRLAKLKLYRSA